MVEVATKYDVDGIHFDYIRYPGPRRLLLRRLPRAVREVLTGTKVANWPADVWQAMRPDRDKWLEFRRGNITAVVAAVSEQVRATGRKVKISAAVFRNWPADRDHVGQDWKLWCEKGYLDFVCPMDYTENDMQFENLVKRQMEWAGRTPCYPGIGVSATRSCLGVDRVIDQIEITRRHHAGGFVIFNYGATEARDLVPMLGLGITSIK